jgi:16S rRNA (cytosine1402-N4)-methyltransferase
MEYHKPVLLAESIDLLSINPDGIYVDTTFGGGGHSNLILKKLGSKGQLFGFDQDPDALVNNITDPRFTLIPHNFEHLKKFLKLNKIEKVDGIIADLGVSSHQINIFKRGFSIRGNGPLDMRMNPKKGISAAEWLNQIDEFTLTKALSDYGEVSRPKKLAQIILTAQNKSPILTTRELLNVIEPHGRKGEKVFAKVFQAIRISINRELEVLEHLLHEGQEILSYGGRFVIISYHSLEDRRVKVYFREGQLNGEAPRDKYGNRLTPFKIITRKPIVPRPKEIEENPRSRSAKLRAAEKKEIFI